VHSLETLWHTALAVFAHSGQLAMLVQSLTLVQAILPQVALRAPGTGDDAHWVKHNNTGSAITSVAIFIFDKPERQGMGFMLKVVSGHARIETHCLFLVASHHHDMPRIDSPPWSCMRPP
jgi:hypothetical protein